MSETRSDRPWEQLQELVESGHSDALLAYLDTMSPMDTALCISRLPVDIQTELLELLSPSDAADVIEDIPDAQAADLIEELEPERAAAIL